MFLLFEKVKGEVVVKKSTTIDISSIIKSSNFLTFDLIIILIIG